MTTIAYRAGVMASDSGSWIGDASHGWAVKLAKGIDGALHGVAGNAAECCAYLGWVKGGYRGDEPRADAEPDNRSSFIVLIVPPEGALRLRTAKGDEVYEAPYFSIGAGSATAYGAMFAGATAEQAIEAAKEHASGAFGPVQSIRHKD
ncbi:ATP-dependent HslUV protease subunit HslV [Aminobacter niigataensis]|uniref:ATP-dependent HslUV protease subunit HslV n=1 Tax=Aminobacter niigataensis TaxID=83265 RepID=A0ABR6L049_9HYPH|nr:hypothetical protein [Aminobacter niigataensis]MBB4649574.1 ATP-dependent HslUV protease subunit HslV [Aminobacter niigataensis]